MNLYRKNGRVNGKAIARLMGTLVIPLLHLRRQRADRSTRTWMPFPPPSPGRAGWVVGLTFLRTGKAVYQGDAEGYEFSETGERIPALQVCYWPGTKAVPVPLGAFMPAPAGARPISPQHLSWDEAPESIKAEVRGWSRRDCPWGKGKGAKG